MKSVRNCIQRLVRLNFSTINSCRNLYISSKKCIACDLTSQRYAIKRKLFKSITIEDENFFRSILGGSRVITSLDELEAHNIDWFNTYKGASKLMLKPKTTEEVSKILNYCNEKSLAVCPQGGNTSVVGGSVPIFDEIILSTALMNKIETIDKWSGAVVCQSGCILDILDQHVSDYGFMIPLDLGSRGSCHLGGNVSTNAGGLRLLRYGNLHGSVLGLEAVLASGEIIDCLSYMKKDNTGYDLKHLFIGSEGTLGLVTKVSIQCATKPLERNVAFLGLSSFETCLQTFSEAKSQLAEILSACEFTDHIALEALKKNTSIAVPLQEYPFYIFLETSGSNECHDSEKVNSFLASELQSGRVLDGIVASDSSKMKSLWRIREEIVLALLRDGYLYTYDVSLPLDAFYEVVRQFQEKLGNKVIRCAGLGHLGDGNIHLCVTTKEFSQEILNMLVPHVYEVVSRYKGSISAEHGIGIAKREFMSYSKSKTAIALMKRIKNVMDPKGILNPYKVLPE